MVFICLWIHLPSQGQILGFQIEDNAKKITIPFEIYNNLIVVPVVVNNRLPLRFILDTGVRTTILTEKTFSDLLNLEYNKKYTIAGIGETPLIEAYITNGVRLTLPGVSGDGHAMLVLEEDYLELRNYLGTEVHGIMGYELFSRFIVGVDYDKRVLTITTPNEFKKRRKWLTIPISVEDTKPYVHGRISYVDAPTDTIGLKLLIDTGASHGLILNQETDPAIHIPEKNIKTSLGRGLGGRLDGKLAKLQSFSIGGACWEDVIATFPNEGYLLDSLTGNTVFRNGSVGGDILSRFKIVFNFPLEEIYVKTGRQFKKDFTYNLSGITVKAIGSNLNQYEIVEVRENSVASESGLKEGDRLISINHVDTNQMELGKVISILNSKPKKKLLIEISRNGQRLRHSIILENRL
jgi:hypothetical protein